MDPTELARELRRQPEPKSDILRSVARELVLPSFAFYMERLPVLEEALLDFRSPVPEAGAKSRATIETIKLAEGIQSSAIQLHAIGAANLPKFTATTDADIDRFALSMRGFFSITLEDQQEAKDARNFDVLVRRKIEEKGIFVLQDSFPREDGSGFCLAHDTHPLILINTKQQTRARRLFMLAHELAHVLNGSDRHFRSFHEEECDRTPLQSIRWQLPCAAVLHLGPPWSFSHTRSRSRGCEMGCSQAQSESRSHRPTP